MTWKSLVKRPGLIILWSVSNTFLRNILDTLLCDMPQSIAWARRTKIVHLIPLMFPRIVSGLKWKESLIVVLKYDLQSFQHTFTIFRHISYNCSRSSWWRHQIETFSALQALCAGNSPVTGEFPAPWPVTRSFEVSFDLRLNKRLSKQSWGWWFETPSRSFWRHRNDIVFVDAPPIKCI